MRAQNQDRRDRDEPTTELTGPDQPRRLIFPETEVRVTGWSDPVLDRLGHDPRSTYVEQFWLPIVGPSCLLLIRRLAAELERQPEGFTFDSAAWSLELGVGVKGGRNGPFWRAIERACRFGATYRNGPVLAVRRRLPPLTARQVDKLPRPLQEAHGEWTAARLKQDRRPTVARWGDRTDPAVAVAGDPVDDVA